MAGPNIIGKHHETGLVQGDNTVVFNFQMEEDTVVDWNKKDFNPVVKVEMKLRGNYQQGTFPFTPESATLQVFPCKWVWTVSLNYQSMKPHGTRVSKMAANRWRNGRHTWIHTGRRIGCHCNGGLCQHRQGRRKRSVIQRIA